MKTIPKVQVTNMYSYKGGVGRVPNQFIVSFPNGKEYFQSYTTIIAFKDSRFGQIYLDRNSWDCSASTGRYRNQYLGEGIAETRKKIVDGTYKLADLNKERGGDFYQHKYNYN
jgi:hypothetical protein